MSETTETEAQHQEHEGPSDWDYVKIALILAVLTIIEVAISYANGIKGLAANMMLLGLATIKFATVALYFMHLKFDSPVLRKLFITGVVLAIVCYTTYLLTLGVFIS